MFFMCPYYFVENSTNNKVSINGIGAINVSAAWVSPTDQSVTCNDLQFANWQQGGTSADKGMIWTRTEPTEVKGNASDSVHVSLAHVMRT